MRYCLLCLTLLIPSVELLVTPASAVAAGLDSGQRRELSQIRKDLGRVSSLIRRKKIDEATALVTEAEEKVKAIQQAAGVDEKDRSVAAVLRLLTTRKALLARATGNDPDAVSFEKDVAPILAKNCHGNRASGGLNLETFAGMERGGRSGPLLRVGNANGSLLIQRLVVAGNARMPRNAQPLPAGDIQKIAAWINAGAKFTGSKDVALGRLEAGSPDMPKKPAVQVTVARPTGDETVSFTKDVAPWMVNLCLRCHNDRQARSGLSLQTFEKLLAGGDSGRVVIPGNLDASRMWDLVGKQDPIKMPPGQALITRTNWNALQTWIKEGAKFDGNDPKADLASLVPTEDDLKMAAFEKLTPEEFAQLRRDRTEAQWKRVLSRETPRSVESAEFFVYGNVSADRLQEVDRWAQEHAKQLRTMFGEKSPRLWKGKLTIFVMKDRFGYEEFNQVINRRRAPRELVGHAEVSATYEDAYVVLQDTGDTSSAEMPSLKTSLAEHVTGAFLMRNGAELPDWIVRGTGLALAGAAVPGDEYLAAVGTGAGEIAARRADRPADIFSDGQFSPSETAKVGYALVRYLLQGGGPGKFGRLIRSLQSGTSLDGALKSVYTADRNAVARGFFATLGSGGKGRGN